MDNAVLEKIVIALVEVLIGIIGGPLVKRLIIALSRKAWDKGAMTFLGSFANISIITMMFIIAADELGLNMRLIVGAFSAVGLGISLALKDNMANVACGLQILLTRPFKVGEYIRVGSHEGRVKSIELMYTVLTTDTNKEAIISNSKIISKTITNYSRLPYRRIKITFPVPCDTDLEKLKTDLIELTLSSPLALKDPAPFLDVKDIDDKTVTVRFFCFALLPNFDGLKQYVSKNIVKYKQQLESSTVTKPAD